MLEHLRHYHLGCGERLQTGLTRFRKSLKPEISDIKRLMARHRSKSENKNEE